MRSEKNKTHFLNQDFEYALILSGDQLYRMDFRLPLAQHIEKKADLTVATIPMPRSTAKDLGIMQIDADHRITRFVEKPKEEELLNSLKLPKEWYPQFGIAGNEDLFLASMGIYIFNRDVLFSLLENNFTDFGKHIIPNAIKTHRIFSYVYQGYWEDIGTIRAFFEANLDITSELPRFNFFDMASPIFTRPRFLPPSKINGATIDHAVLSDGCIVNYSYIANSIIGLRSLVDRGSYLNRVIVLGSDYYEPEESIKDKSRMGVPRVGIGKHTRIENAIIDKNARIGDNCVITPANKPENVTEKLYCIRDGIVIIPKNTIIPHGTVI